MNILVPFTVTSVMLAAGTSIAEPAAGETAWVSGGTYAIGDKYIRSTTHRVYEAVQAHTARSALPEVDTAYWLDVGPTQRFAPFDIYTSTAATAVTSLTYVLTPGFFNAISLYGLVGYIISLTLRDAPGGAVIWSRLNVDLFEQATGLYELLFTPLRQRSKLIFSDLPVTPTAELTLTISAGTGEAVGLGMMNIGDLRRVIGEAEWGGTEYGASAEPKTYSYIKYNDDGSMVIKRRGSATDLRGTVTMPASAAEYATAVIQEVLDVPVSCVATTEDGYDYLNVFGLVSATVTADNFGFSKLSFTVRGAI